MTADFPLATVEHAIAELSSGRDFGPTATISALVQARLAIINLTHERDSYKRQATSGGRRDEVVRHRQMMEHQSIENGRQLDAAVKNTIALLVGARDEELSALRATVEWAEAYLTREWGEVGENTMEQYWLTKARTLLEKS